MLASFKGLFAFAEPSSWPIEPTEDAQILVDSRSDLSDRFLGRSALLAHLKD